MEILNVAIDAIAVFGADTFGVSIATAKFGVVFGGGTALVAVVSHWLADF